MCGLYCCALQVPHHMMESASISNPLNAASLGPDRGLFAGCVWPEMCCGNPACVCSTPLSLAVGLRLLQSEGHDVGASARPTRMQHLLSRGLPSWSALGHKAKANDREASCTPPWVPCRLCRPALACVQPVARTQCACQAGHHVPKVPQQGVQGLGPRSWVPARQATRSRRSPSRGLGSAPTGELGGHRMWITRTTSPSHWRRCCRSWATRRVRWATAPMSDASSVLSSTGNTCTGFRGWGLGLGV